MDDAAAVRERHRLGHLDEDLEKVGQLVRLESQSSRGVERVLERLTLHEPHAEKAPDAVVLSELVHRHDVGVLELAGDACLGGESLDLRVASRELGRQDFDGHIALQVFVERAHHRAHPADADELLLDEALGLSEVRLACMADPRPPLPLGLLRLARPDFARVRRARSRRRRRIDRLVFRRRRTREERSIVLG